MRVKIEFQRFTGFAELGGAELEVLTKIFAKMQGAQEHWLRNESVFVPNDDTADFKAEIKPNVKYFMLKKEFDMETDVW